MKTLVDVVIAHSKDLDSNVGNLVQSAGSAQLATLLRLASAESDLAILQANLQTLLAQTPAVTPRVQPQGPESLGSPAWPRPSSTSRT